jgi:hypothetical protein
MVLLKPLPEHPSILSFVVSPYIPNIEFGERIVKEKVCKKNGKIAMR